MEKKKEIKSGNVPLDFDFKGTHYIGEAKPVATSCNEEGCFELDVTLNGHVWGTLKRVDDRKWTLSESADEEMVSLIGEMVQHWYF